MGVQPKKPYTLNTASEVKPNLATPALLSPVWLRSHWVAHLHLEHTQQLSPPYPSNPGSKTNTSVAPASAELATPSRVCSDAPIPMYPGKWRLDGGSARSSSSPEVTQFTVRAGGLASGLQLEMFSTACQCLRLSPNLPKAPTFKQLTGTLSHQNYTEACLCHLLYDPWANISPVWKMVRRTPNW